MSEPNLTREQVVELEALMPAPDKCPHGSLPAHTARGLKNLCNECFQQAKVELEKRRQPQ